MALLVDQSCYSACELEAFGFSQVPGMMVIGMYPTGGTEAEVSRGQFNLPEGISLQIPFGRFVLPDGSLFLEGSGVQPTLKVPITAQNVLSTDDVVLNTADQQINK
jgi:C-terminal processing protease CtpA/Prc